MRDTYPDPGSLGPAPTVGAARPLPGTRTIVLRPRLPWRPLAWLGVVLLVLSIVAAGTGYRYEPVDRATVSMATPDLQKGPRAVRSLKAKGRQLAARLDRAGPRGVYVVVDQTHNRLYLKKDEDVLRTAVCSAGSGMVLREGEAGRKWVFDTPRGLYRVQNKVRNPIWKKPDWASGDFLRTKTEPGLEHSMPTQRGCLILTRSIAH